jgi:hypothetical protein
MGPGMRLRAEADLAGADRGPQLALGQVGLGWNPSVLSPMIAAVGIGPKEV